MSFLINYLKQSVRWLSTWGTLPVWSWLKASKYYKNGQFESAAFYFVKGIERFPTHPARGSALLDAAFCYFQICQLDKAERCAQLVIENQPSRMNAYVLLAKIQLWSGRPWEAAQTLKNSFLYQDPDTERLGLFLYAVIEFDGPSLLLDEALKRSATHVGIDDSCMMQTAIAALLVKQTQSEKALYILDEVLLNNPKRQEAYILKAQILGAEYKIPEAMSLLRECIRIFPHHPRALSLMAEYYLKAGESFNAEYALQLALQGAKASGWKSVREMHVLAECYYHTGDRAEALMIAHRAREVGTKTHGRYSNVHHLERLIESLQVTQ